MMSRFPAWMNSTTVSGLSRRSSAITITTSKIAVTPVVPTNYAQNCVKGYLAIEYAAKSF